MRSTFTTLSTVFILLLLAVLPASAFAQTIINENGDFSDANIGDNSGITNWALEGSDYATFEVVEDPDDAGNQVLRVEITDIGSVGNAWDIQPLHQNTELVAGESYTVSVRVKADNAGGGTPTISLDPGYNAQYGVDISGSSEWQTIEIDLFNATASASQQVGIHLGSENNADADIFYIDDLEIVNAEAPALWTFESGSYADWDLGDIGGMLNITDAFVMAGDSALQVTAVDTSLETNFQNDVFDNIAAGDTIKYNIYITSDDLDLVNGFQAFWFAPDWAYNSEWLGTEGITADEWSTIEFVMPEYDEPLNRFGLQMLLTEGNEAETPSFYVDDISVTPGAEPEPDPEPSLAWDFEDQDMGDWSLQDDDNYTTTGGISDAQAFEGTYSVEVSVGNDAANGALINDNQDIAPGDSLIFQVYVPADQIDDINGLQSFVQYSDSWTYIDTWFGSGDLTTDAWNKVFYVVPDSIEGETIQRIGLQVTGSEASGTPTVFVDNIEIIEFTEPAPVDPPSTESVVWNFDNPADINSWVNGANSSQTFAGNTDAAEGDSSLHWTYTVDPSESWGGSADIELIMEGELLTDLTDYDGMSLDYKVIEPVTPTDGGATFNMKIYVESGENGEELEQWHYTVPGILGDDSGEWQTAEILLEDFAIPSFVDTFDGELYPDRIHKIEMQVIVGSDGSESTGEILLDNFLPYTAPLPIPEPPHEIGDIINYNGSFQLSELGENEPAAWTVTADDASLAEVVADAADDDDRALSFTVNWTGNTNWYENEVVNEPIHVVEGDEYSISVRLKADSDERVAGFYMGMPGSGGWERARGWDTPLLSLTDEWQEFSFTHTATENNETHGMRVGIELNTEENDGGTIYIDSVQVEKVDAVSNEAIEQPLAFELYQNYPNPFNPTTSITYTLPQSADVRLDVFNVLGQRVMTLVNERQTSGLKQVSFDASNLASGVYLYRIQTANFVKSRRMTLIK